MCKYSLIMDVEVRNYVTAFSIAGLYLSLAGWRVVLLVELDPSGG